MACTPEEVISSGDLDGLKKDISTIDDVVESNLDTTTTKSGKVINTLSGQLKLLGFQAPIAYTASIVFTVGDGTKTVEEAGVVYAPLPSALPFTTSGTFIGDDDDRFFPIQALTTGWQPFTGTPTQTSATTFTLVGNQTPTLQIGRRIKLIDSSDLFGTITDSVFTSLTTVTVLLESGVLSGSLTSVELGISTTEKEIGTETVGFWDSTITGVNRTLTDKLNDQVNGEDKGVVGDDSTDNTVAMATANYVANSTINLGAGDYQMGVFNEGLNIKGVGSATLLKPVDLSTNEGFALSLGLHTLPHGDWDYRYISDLAIESDGVAGGGCIRFDTATVTDEEFLGRYVLKNLSLRAPDGICVEKEFGNIGNTYDHVTYHTANYHHHATGTLTPVQQHTGADTWNQCRMQRADTASIYINDGIDGGGGWVFNQGVIEQNGGFGIFAKSDISTSIAKFVPMTLNQVWFERNGPESVPTPPTTVTIDGDVLEPRDMYFKGMNNVIINGSFLKSMTIIETDIIARDCRIGSASGFYDISKDDDSTIQLWNPSGNFMGIVDEWSHTAPSAFAPYVTNRSPCLRMAHRWVNAAATSRTIAAVGFEKETNAWTGTAAINSTQVLNDGLTLTNCTSLTAPASHTLFSTESTVTLPTAKWCVLSVGMKIISGLANISDVKFSDNGAPEEKINSVRQGVVDEWVTSVCMVDMRVASALPNISLTVITNSGGAAVIQFADCQIAAFDTKQQCIDFIHSGIFEYTA